MDSPFLPALVCFGPLFLMLLVFALFRRGRERNRVPPMQMVVAFMLSLGVGAVGAVASLLLL